MAQAPPKQDPSQWQQPPTEALAQLIDTASWIGHLAGGSPPASFTTVATALLHLDAPSAKWFRERLTVETRAEIHNALKLTTQVVADSLPAMQPEAAPELTGGLGTIWTISTDHLLEAANRHAADRNDLHTGIPHLLAALVLPQPEGLMGNSQHSTELREWGLTGSEWMAAVSDHLKQHGGETPPDTGPTASRLARVLNDLSTVEHPPEDALNLKKDARAFARVILDRETTPPLSVGLFGDWGSGKSAFMGFIREETAKLAAKSEESDSKIFYRHVAQISFNAWHYVEANLWASLVHTLFTGLEKTLNSGRTDNPANQVMAELISSRRQREEAESALLAAKNKGAEAYATYQKRREAAEQSKLSLSQILAGDGVTRVWDALPDDIRKEADELKKRYGINELSDTWTEVTALHRDSLGLFGQLSFVLQRFKGLGWSVLAVVLVGGTFALTHDWTVAWLDEFAVKSSAAAATLLGLVQAARARVGTVRKAMGGVVGAITEAQRREYASEQALYQMAQRDADHALEQVTEAARQVAQAEAAVADLKEIAPKQLAKFIEDRVASGEYRDRLGIISTIREDFDQLSRLMAAANERPVTTTESGSVPPRHVDRIVLYIDDLDRCPPDRVVEVLEAVHLLMSFDLFVVFVGVDERWVSRSLLDHYPMTLADGNSAVARSLTVDGALGSAALRGDVAWEEPGKHPNADLPTPHDYLEKIFQIPFWLQGMNRAGATNYVKQLTDPVEEERETDGETREAGNADGSAEGATPEGPTPATEQSPTEVPDNGDLEQELNGDEAPKTKDTGFGRWRELGPGSFLMDYSGAPAPAGFRAAPDVLRRMDRELVTLRKSEPELGDPIALVMDALKDGTVPQEAFEEMDRLVERLADVDGVSFVRGMFTSLPDTYFNRRQEPEEIPAEPVTFTQAEQDYLVELVKKMESTPRRVKRMVNVYRLLKGRGSDGEKLEVGEYYPEILTLQAVVVAVPLVAADVLHAIRDRQANGTDITNLDELIAWLESAYDGDKEAREASHAALFLKQYQDTAPDADLERLRKWGGRVARFTFRSGRASYRTRTGEVDVT